MDKNTMIETIQANRMRLTEQTNAVMDDTLGVFFCLTDKGLFSFEGDEYDYDKIVEFTFNQHTSSYFISYENDGCITSVQFAPRKSIDMDPMLLSKLLPIIIPGMETKVYYDIMRSRGMFNGSLWGKGDQFQPIVDWDFEMVYSMIMRAYKEWKFKKQLSERLCQMGLDLFMCNHQRNLWFEWITSIKWDGKKRLDTFFKDTIGASAPALQESGKEQIYLSSVTRAFFYGAIQRATKETVMEVIPVLISNKQGIGKTSLVRYIAGPNKDWYRSIGTSIDDEKKFWEDVNGGKIVELSESEALKTTRVNQLKSFISKSSDTFREAYARYSHTYDRHWVMIATSNEQKMFVDKTGNRRFYPIICGIEKPTFKFYDQYSKRDFSYIEQVWAEAYHDLMNDPAASCIIEPDSEISELAGIMQESSTYVDDRFNAIDDYLDNPENGLNLQGSRISRADIINAVFGENPSKPEKETTYTLTKWAECTKKWRLIPSTTYKGRSVRNVFERKNDCLDIREKFSEDEIIDGYYKFARKYNIGEMKPAQLDEYLKSLGLPVNYMDSLIRVLNDGLVLYKQSGEWFRC